MTDLFIDWLADRRRQFQFRFNCISLMMSGNFQFLGCQGRVRTEAELKVQPIVLNRFRSFLRVLTWGGGDGISKGRQHAMGACAPRQNSKYNPEFLIVSVGGGEGGGDGISQGRPHARGACIPRQNSKYDLIVLSRFEASLAFSELPSAKGVGGWE